MDKARDDLGYRKVNRLTAIQLATTSMVILVVAIVAILQNGHARQLLRRVEILEARIERLESATSSVLAPAYDLPLTTPKIPGGESAENHAAINAPTPPEAARIDHELIELAARMRGGITELDRRGASALLLRIVSEEKSSNIAPGACLAAAEIAMGLDDALTCIQWASRARSGGLADPLVARLLATAHEKMGDFDAALDEARLAAGSADAPAESRLRLGRLAWRLGHVDETRSALAPLIDEPTVRFEVVDLLARVLVHEEQPERALDMLEAAVAESPGEATILRRLAMVRLEVSAFEGCVKAARGAIGAGADDPEIGMVLGRCLLEEGDFAGATDTMRALIARNPDDHGAWSQLGTVRLTALDPTGAASAFEEAVRIDPASADSWYRLGVAQVNADLCAAAAGSFDTCVGLEPGFANAHFARAICQARLGDADGAEASLVRALAIDGALMQQAERVPVLAALLGTMSEKDVGDVDGGEAAADSR